jgi:hypothetical protein
LPAPAVSSEFQLTRRVKGQFEPVQELPPADGVRNPVLGVLISLVDQDLSGRVSQSRLERAAREGGDEKIPWQYLLWVRREPSYSLRHPVITVRLLAESRLPVPYSVLGYHPGSVLAPRLLVLDEWRQGDWTHRYWEAEELRTIALQDLTLFGRRSGALEIDVDGWLDWLMGAKLDDIEITGMALFTHEGRRYAMAFGYNPEGQGRTGVLDLMADELLFPPPPEYRVLGRTLRAWVEELQSHQELSFESESAP